MTSHARAALLMLGSTVFFGLMAVTIRLASESLDTFEVAFFRNLFGLLALLPLLRGRMRASLRTIDQFDFTSGRYTRLLDLDTLAPDLGGTFVGGITASGGATERVLAFFGGASQDRHRFVVLFDRANPS